MYHYYTILDYLILINAKPAVVEWAAKRDKFKSDYFNCLEKCDYYEYSLSNSIYCTESFICPNGYKLIEDKKECIDDCSKDSEYKFELDTQTYTQAYFSAPSSVTAWSRPPITLP